MNLLFGLPFIAIFWGVLMPFVFLDGASGYLKFLWGNPRLLLAMVTNLGIVSYWLARRLSQALLLRSTGAKLKASHEPS